MSPPDAAGPATHYALFAGLREAGVIYLVTGATALTLHGVPRLTPDVDLVLDPDPANLERLRRLLAGWGYDGSAPGAGTPSATVRRFRHPTAALGQIDVVEHPRELFSRLAARAVAASLVDVDIPLVSVDDLRALKGQSAEPADREDAAGLAALASIRAGEQGAGENARREQIRKFSRWSVAARLDWLLAAARLSKGLAPEARPLTRGLVRRRGWYGR